MMESISRLQTENDILSSAQTLLQDESTKNRVNIKWIRNYLDQNEAKDAAPDVAKASKTLTTTSPF